MKLKLFFYVAQVKRGHYSVSIPWIEELCNPISGPSPSQLREELMFRILELVHGGLDPSDLDRLLAPEAPYLSSVYMDIHRKVRENRPEIRLAFSTHTIVGAFANEDITRIWLPKVPGVCIAIENIDDMYAAVNRWAIEYAEARNLSTFENLACNYVANIEQMEVDFGYPTPSIYSDEVPAGRLTRPEVLVEVADNLTHRIEDNTLGHAFGREETIEELANILTSPQPASVCLIGDSGVGKTALIHEAAHRAFALSKRYQERRDIWQTNGDRIIAGMSIIGQWEQRVESFCRELSERGDLLFTEDLLGVVRAGRTYSGNSNVGNFIEPYLEEHRFAMITEATDETYALARSVSPGLVDQFRRIQVPPLSYRDTLAVITDLVREMETTLKTKIVPDGIESILHLSRRFFRNEAYPGKAVRLLRQCHSEGERRFEDSEDREPIRVDANLVCDVVHRQTGLPMTILKPGTGRHPSEIERAFSGRVFSQELAIRTVSKLVVAIEQGVIDPEKPLASLLLIGPSGVGKTETAKALSEDLFGSVDRLIRFDMSEFNSAGAATRLIGNARNPDGELTSKVRSQPFCVLLFDEIEKAHSLVLDLLLQILGDGRLSDAAGRVVDFRNTIVIMTSNLGASTEDRWMGFGDVSSQDRAQHYRSAAESFFRPEIFNRIDSVVPYRPLGSDALRKIARRTLQKLLNRRGIRRAQMMIDVDEGLIEIFANSSVDARYGARTLSHRIEQKLINPLAKRLTEFGMDQGLSRVYLSAVGEEVDFHFERIEKAEISARPKKASDFGDIVERLKRLSEDVDALAKDPRTAELEQDYEKILIRMNEWEGEKFPAELAESLRRRDVYRGRLAGLEKRMAGLQDPRGTGEFLFIPKPEELKEQTRKWDRIAQEIEHKIIWTSALLDDLSSSEMGSTLVISGLSGQYDAPLKQWRRWIAALSEKLDFALLIVGKTNRGWEVLSEPSAKKNHSPLPYTALAFSSDDPGVRRLFRALEGYIFYPLPASKGTHTLVLNRALESSFTDANGLIEHMTQHRFEEKAYRIEFEIENGQIKDFRRDIVAPFPEESSINLLNFVTSLAISRIGKQET